MRDKLLPPVALAAVAVAMWFGLREAPGPAPTAPAPKVAPKAPDAFPDAFPAPEPDPQPKPKPKPKRPRPWGEDEAPVGALRFATGGPVAPDGTEVQCEIPVGRRLRNIGSRRDGAGMCVTTSATVAADWQNLPRAWLGLRDWAAQFPGGSWPEKHAQQVRDFARAKSMPVEEFVTYEGRDPGPALDLILGTGRMACLSWMNGAHWLNCVHLDERQGCIMDNNGPASNLRWLPRAELLRQTTGSRGAWLGTWARPGPPPVPKGDGAHPAPRPTASPCPNCTCGCAEGLPCSCRPVVEAPTIYGVVHPQRALPRPHGWRISGKLVSEAQARARLGEPTGAVPDDRARLYLTVIGGKSARLGVLAALKSSPALAPFRGRYIVHGYAPTDWAVSGLFATAGEPTIYLQARDGTVLMRVDKYQGPEDLAGRLRRRDPDYQPQRDPDGAPPATPVPAAPGVSSTALPAGTLEAGSASLGAIVLAGFYHLLLSRKDGFL